MKKYRIFLIWFFFHFLVVTFSVYLNRRVFVVGRLLCSTWEYISWHVRRKNSQISLRIRTGWSESSFPAWRNLAFVAIKNVASEDSDPTTWTYRRYVFWHCDSFNWQNYFVSFFFVWPKMAEFNVSYRHWFCECKILFLFMLWFLIGQLLLFRMFW